MPEGSRHIKNSHGIACNSRTQTYQVIKLLDSSSASRWQGADATKDKGNALFKAEKFEEAAQSYIKAYK
eukprot:473058-Hanusia_phi.AAC.3